VLGVRPEHVRFTSEGGLRGQVFGAEYLGSTQIVTVDTAVGKVKARLPADRLLQPGEPIGLTFRPERLSVFDKISGKAVRSALHEGAARG
jgi:multiple sugar transport system ATP-binding protein